jgi:hypothetical protein
MITRHRKASFRRNRLDSEQRRALQMLASLGPSGITESIMLAQGFSTAVLDDIARAGLAAASTCTARAGVSVVTVLWFRITAAGRRAIYDA